MATKRKAKRRGTPRPWTPQEERELKTHSKRGTSAAVVAKIFKRTMGATRQKAHALKIPLGSRTRTRSRTR